MFRCMEVQVCLKGPTQIPTTQTVGLRRLGTSCLSSKSTFLCRPCEDGAGSPSISLLQLAGRSALSVETARGSMPEAGPSRPSPQSAGAFLSSVVKLMHSPLGPHLPFFCRFTLKTYQMSALQERYPGVDPLLSSRWRGCQGAPGAGPGLVPAASSARLT